MQTSLRNLAALLPIAAVGVQAVTHTVQVGKSGLIFSPDSVTAAAGDVVEFVIYPSHNVARSSFSSPCNPISGSQSIWSGDDLPSGTMFSVTVNNTDPIWLYCATFGHCSSGMAMVVNPPSGGDTLAAYKTAAQQATEVAPTVVAGGVYGAPSGGSSGSSSASESTRATMTMESSSAAMTSGGSMTTSRAMTSGESMTSGGSMTSSRSMASASGASSTPNAAPTMVANLLKIGGAVLGGAALVL